MVRMLGILTTIPMLLAAGPLVAFFIGRWIDQRLGSAWVMPVLVILGLIAGIRETYRVIKKAGEE